MRRGLAIILASLLIAACTPAALAASAGGTIGKRDKSVSGGEPETPAQPKKRKPVASRSEEGGTRSKKNAACGRVPGIWTANGWWNGLYGRGDVTFNADGSARHISGIVGTWTCDASNHFVIDWKDWAHGEGTLSADGNTVTLTDGGTMTRGR